MKTRLPFLPLLLAAVLGLRAEEPQPDPLAPLRNAMRAEQYPESIALAEKFGAAANPGAGEALYLKALALFHSKKFAECAETAGALAEAAPKSDWRHKAVFLKAQALVEQKKFQEAAAIYQAEAARVLSADRKEGLVQVVAEFARKLTLPADPAVPDSPKPDFQKAVNLYAKALAMEISRPLRDDLLFRKGRAVQQTGNAGQAMLEFQAYLTEFDPAWTGPAGSGSPRQPMQIPPPAGRHIAEARFHLAEAQIQAGNAAAGRMELEDLLKLNPEGTAALTPEIHWLMVKSHVVQPEEAGGSNRNALMATNSYTPGQTIGNTGGLPTENVRLYALRDGDLDAAVKACRDYLAAHPEGSRAVRAAWMIAEVLESAGRAEDAIAAYRDVIAGKGFRLPEVGAEQKYDEEIRAFPATHLANLKMRAVFRVGEILGRQKKHEQAIAAWQGYVKDYPNGPQWAESQNAIINAEFQMGMDALAGGDEAAALQRFEAFLNAHPLDERSPRILYLFGAVHEARAAGLEKAKGAKAEIDAAYRRAVDEWSKLVSKYPQSPEARIALLKSGGLHEEKFGEFEKALHIYRKLAEEFGYGGAQASTARLTQKALELSAERTFRTNEKAVVKLKLRNIEKVSFRLHKIDLQAYFRKMHGIGGVEGLDVSLIQPDKTWEFKPEGYAKYKPFEQEVEIPFPGNEPGAYVVTAGDDEWESTVLVLRSDLEVIVKSSRREVLAFVQDMVTGKPAEGVDILVSDGKAVAATGRTGADGVFKTALESLKDLGDVRLFALGKGHAASFNLDLAGLQRSSGLTAKGYLYTDRPVYQPGETVSLRGILREVRDTAYAVPENSEFKVGITDPQGRLLSEQTVKIGRFGTFDASLALPSAAASGSYTLAAHQERKGREPLHFQGTFEVRPFKLEKIKLAMDFPRRVWFRGEKIEAVITTAYYWGEPLAGRTLRCTLPDGRTQSVTTDAEGRATLAFDTTAMRPGSVLTFAAALDGESMTVTETVTLARLGFSIAAKPSQPVVIAGEPFDLGITTTAADGKPAGQALKLAVLRVEQPKVSPVMTLLPWPRDGGVEVAEVMESELEIKTDAATGKATAPLKLEKGGLYRLRVTGTDRFGQTITQQSQVEVSDDTGAIKLRLFADSATLKVARPRRCACILRASNAGSRW
ncbi:MAG: MG2 domain-containing protein [Kiritimatiellia bacterium]